MQASDWDVDSSGDDYDVRVVVSPGAATSSSTGLAAGEGTLVARDAEHRIALRPGVLDLSAVVKRRHDTTLAPTRTTDMVGVLIPSMGTEVVQRVATAACIDGDAKNSSYQPFLDAFCDATTTSSIPGRAIIARLTGGATHTHVAEQLEASAAAMYFGARAWIQSTLAAILGGVARKEYKLMGVFKVFGSDSTSLPIGAVTWSSRRRAPELPQLTMTAHQPSDLPSDIDDTCRPKMHQSSWSLAFWFRDTDDKDSLLEIPLVVPLQISDSGVADVVYACWEESMGLELLDDVSKAADAVYSHLSMYRDSSNIKADREWIQNHPEDDHYRDGCYAHCTFTVAGAVFGTCSGLVSGVVSLDLSTRAGALWKLFKRTHADVLFESIEHVDADIPDLPGPCVDHLDAVLDAFIPNDARGMQRRRDIRWKVQCDIRLEVIYVYRKGGMSDKEKREYADNVSDLLIPRRIGSLRRQRWLTTTRPLKETSLLACFWNSLERTLLHFYRRARKKPELSMRPARPVIIEEPLSEDDVNPLQPEAGPPVTSDGSPDWAAWNKTQQRGVDRWRRSKPSAPLVVTCLSADPLAKLASSIIFVHSEQYALQQRAEHTEGRQYTTIGMAMIKGDGFEEFKTSMSGMLLTEEPWRPLAPEIRTLKTRSLATISLTRSWAGAEQMIFADARRSPHDLDELLWEPSEERADQLLHKPYCMRAPPYQRHCAKYDSVQKLTGRDSITSLWIRSYLYQRCAMVLESRMALLRSLTHQRVHTWQKSFVDIQSEWFVLQSRGQENDCKPPRMKKPRENAPRVVKKEGTFKGRRTGGGGARRSGLSHKLRAMWSERRKTKGRVAATNSELSVMMTRAHAAAAHAERVDPELWKMRGLAGTISHRQNKKAFGKHMPPPPASRAKKSKKRARSFEVDPQHGTEGVTMSVVRAAISTTAREAAQREAATEKKVKRQHILDQEDRIREWTENNRGPTVAPTVPAASVATVWPTGHPLYKFPVLRMASPSVELASAALAGITDKKRDIEQVPGYGKESLLDAWYHRCEGMLAANCRKCSAPINHPTICSVCGRCLCSTPEGRNTMRFVKALTHVFIGRPSGVLLKGMHGRILYDNGRACVRIHRQGKTIILRPKDIWFHLSYGNLTGNIFHVFRLVAGASTVFGEELFRITLEWDGNEPSTLWDVLGEIDVTKNYDLEIWQMVWSDDIVDPFLPSVVDLERPDPCILERVWRTNPLINLPVPALRGPTPVVPVPIEDWTCAVPTEPPPNPLAEALSKARRQLQAFGRCKGRNRKGRGRGMGKPMVITDWDVLSSDSSSSSGVGNGRGGGGDGGGDGGEAAGVVTPFLLVRRLCRHLL